MLTYDLLPHVLQATPVPRRVLQGIRDGDGRFRALGSVEAERAQEAGEVVLEK